MNEHGFIELISGRQRGPMASLARFGLRCLAPFYACAVRLRNAGYAMGIKPTHRVAVPVISVGNITTGGTGKTPIVALIANWLSDHGERPCLLSRGYRAIDDEGNDEKRLLERLCPGVLHLQDPDRVASSEIAVAEHNASVLVLDDGFQHRRLGRDLNIVLVDATNPFGHNFVLPRGLLREPLNGLRRADLIVLTRCDQVSSDELQKIRSVLARYKKPVLEFVFKPTQLVRTDGSTDDFSVLDGHTVGAFCGIGNPDAFRTTLDSVDIDPAFFEPFPDHSHYDTNQRRVLSRLIGKHAASAVVCTEKDIVKLPNGSFGDVDVFGVRVEAVATAGEAELFGAMQSLLLRRQPSA